jgi:hypothetical protein
MARQDPGLEGEARRVRGHGNELSSLDDHSLFGAQLVMHDIAKHAPFLVVVVLARTVNLFAQMMWHERQRNQLRMAVVERRTGGNAMVLEHEDAAQPPILFEIDHSVPERPEHLPYRRFWQGRQRLQVIRRLDNHLVRANTVHAIEDTVAATIDPALHLQRRHAVWHDPDVPAR